MAKMSDLNKFRLCWGCWEQITARQPFDTVKVGSRDLPIHRSCVGKETVAERNRRKPWPPPVDTEPETGHDGHRTT